MISEIRRFLAILSGVCLSASLVLYLASFLGATMDGISRLALVLHAGIFVLMLSMFLTERSAFRDKTFFWSGFSRGKPDWIVPAIKWAGYFFIVNFVLFLVMSHAASPQIRDGEYVLNNHGEILRTLTRSEYLHLKGAELRLFASGWMFFYLIPTTYWWFPRQSHNVV